MRTAGGQRWALLLAGGDGTRLQALTRLIAGAPIPKQYCRIARIPQHLLVTRADGLGWSDWGTREAVERTLAAMGREPAWRSPALATA